MCGGAMCIFRLAPEITWEEYNKMYCDLEEKYQKGILNISYPKDANGNKYDYIQIFSDKYTRSKQEKEYYEYFKSHFKDNIQTAVVRGNNGPGFTFELLMVTKIAYRLGIFLNDSVKCDKYYNTWYKFTKKDMIKMLNDCIYFEGLHYFEAYEAFDYFSNFDFHEGTDIFAIYC